MKTIVNTLICLDKLETFKWKLFYYVYLQIVGPCSNKMSKICNYLTTWRFSGRSFFWSLTHPSFLEEIAHTSIIYRRDRSYTHHLSKRSLIHPSFIEEIAHTPIIYLRDRSYTRHLSKRSLIHPSFIEEIAHTPII